MDFTISAQKFALFDNRYFELHPIKNPKHA